MKIQQEENARYDENLTDFAMFCFQTCMMAYPKSPAYFLHVTDHLSLDTWCNIRREDVMGQQTRHLLQTILTSMKLILAGTSQGLDMEGVFCRQTETYMS